MRYIIIIGIVFGLWILYRIYLKYFILGFREEWHRRKRADRDDLQTRTCPLCGSINTKVVDPTTKRLFCAGCGAFWVDGEDYL